MCLSWLAIAAGQSNLTADDILQKSILYHDPTGILMDTPLLFELVETRPNGQDRLTSILINIPSKHFEMTRHYDSISIKTSVHAGQVQFLVNDNLPPTDEWVRQYHLNPQRAEMLKNYYEYLWLLPIKLTDPGTILHQQVKRKEFFGAVLLELKVTYKPEVGSDSWYFYFDPELYALKGYRFYHDEQKGDGEYILLEGEEVFKKLKLPKTRKWYTHQDDRFLGSDTLKDITTGYDIRR